MLPPQRILTVLSVVAIVTFVSSILLAGELHVEQFGAVGDGIHDDGPALRRTFDAASRAEEPCTIFFEQDKVYYLAPHDEAHGRLMLRQAADVTVEGRQAMLLVHPPNRALGIYRSHDIVVRDLQLDYRPLPFVQGTITDIDNDHSFLEFQPHRGFAPPVEGDASLYQNGRNEDSVTFDRDTRKFYQTHARVSEVKDIGDGRFRISYRGRTFTQARIGDYFAMKHRWGPRTAIGLRGSQDPARANELISTPDPSISVAHSNRVRLENIRSYASPGMTLNARGCTDLVVRGVMIQRHDNRLVAGCSDGMHIKCNESQPLIQNCFIEGTMDDAIHIKISGDWITQVASPRRVKIRHMDIAWDNTNLGKGKQVIVYDHDGKRQLAAATIAQYQPLDFRSGWVTLDREVRDMAAGDSFYLEAAGEAVIERCRFGTQLQRAILTHQPTVIRDCLIEDTGQGIVVDFTDIEGPPSQRLCVEHCTFNRLTRRAIYVQCPSKLYDQKGDPQFICRDSTFNLSPDTAALQIVNSQGVLLQNNRFHFSGRQPPLEQYRILENSPLR